jgi:hypothetical protein
MPEADVQSPAGAAEDIEQSTDATDDQGGPESPKMSDKQIASYFKTRIESCEREKNNIVSEWKRNVELRIGYIATLYTGGTNIFDEVQTEINPDWSLTKTKTANLFSQVPTVRLTHENTAYRAALPSFAKQLNYEISPKRSNIAAAMEECLNDMVNAAGVCLIFTGYAARYAEKLVPVLDEQFMAMIPEEVRETLEEVEVEENFEPTPEALELMLLAKQLPMKRAHQVISDKIFTRRISPIDGLWPSDFVGSDFNDSDFSGYKGTCSWAEAKLEFKLDDNLYSKVVTGANEPADQTLRSNPERGGLAETKKVKFRDLYYWRYRVDPDEKSLDCIWRIVYVEGMDKPAIHEPWKGQQKVFVDEMQPDAGHYYIGNTRFPVQFCTLTYITDNPIPPSDSSAGRPQVNDMRRSRRDMFNNRAHSVPIRWFDVNRIDQTIQTMLMRGTWQGMIPTNGDGSRAIGEIARASYPSENLAFDQQALKDLTDTWQISPNQNSGSMQDSTATAASITQQNFATRIGQERNRVAQFFLNVCELVAGYMVLYSDFGVLTEEQRAAMEQAWDNKRVTKDLAFSILPDSQVVLDSNTRIQKLVNFLNITVKSGFVNPKPIIVEIAELSGIDPTEVVVDPQPPVPESPIKFSFSGKDDLTNVLVLATFIAKGEPPTMDHIEQAKQMLIAAGGPPMPPQMPEAGPGQLPAGPEGGEPPPPGEPPPGPTPVPQGGTGANAAWHTADKIAKRSRDTEA